MSDKDEQIKTYDEALTIACSERDEAYDEIDALRQRIEELEEALRPMKDGWDRLQSDGGINNPEMPSHGTGTIKQKHLRRAASLLSEQPETGEPASEIERTAIPLEPGNIASHAGKAAILAMPNFIPGYDAEDMAMSMARTVWTAMAKALNESSEPTPPHAHGDVERVKVALMACLKRGGELDPDNPEDEANRFWEFAGLVDPDELARAAASAMRGSVKSISAGRPK